LCCICWASINIVEKTKGYVAFNSPRLQDSIYISFTLGGRGLFWRREGQKNVNPQVFSEVTGDVKIAKNTMYLARNIYQECPPTVFTFVADIL
jgi:hypothetical protein